MRRTRSRRRSAFAIADPARLTVAVLIGVVLAGALFVQAASSVVTRDAPQVAARLLVPNGLAGEQYAAQLFTAAVRTRDDIGPAARGAAPTALAAFRDEALTPKAHAILALAQADPAARADILAAATRINRRDLLLQGLVLEEQVGAGDFAGSLATLDRLLKVHPEQQATLFPVLMRALGEAEAVPVFLDVLDGSAEWHTGFLDFAVRDRAALPALARLRESGPIGGPDFDRKLVVGLADSGRIDRAYALFQRISGKEAASGVGTIDWNSDFAPFDWRFADEGGFRAQLARNRNAMEIFVRGGQGGLIAERLIRAPEGRFGISLSHRISPADQVRDVRLQLRCAGDQTPFFDARFALGENLFEVGTVPAGCRFLSVGINARAWSGRSALRGTVGRIAVVPLAAAPAPESSPAAAPEEG